MGSLDGRVAIVTGAAHGLGRLHALNLAKEGARVVVNDLGADVEGKGNDASAAQQVVNEIVAAGGDAVAHYGDVASFADAEALIQTAAERFGDLHILINNAGFTRDALIYSMTEKDFDDVVRVHLKGHFAPSKFAMNYWRARSKAAGGPIFARLISTASESAFFGTPGQPNYAPAKAGIVSLTMGLAQLGLKMGLTANVVMPRARTRMTLRGPNIPIFQKPESGFDNFAPENSSPLFVYLCTPQAQRISGHVFIVWGKEVKVIGRPEPKTTFQSPEPWTVAGLHRQLGPHFEKLEPVTDGYTVPPI
jgi:3-oxoacyl-[acyl-carrier protein] reductase